MIVAASPQAARAHQVRLEVALRYQMQCNYPGAGRLVVTFPSAMKLPRQFALGAVELGGKPFAVKVSGRKVTGTVPAPKGVLCSTIGPGSVTLVFTRKAKLQNPRRAGSYRFAVTHVSRMFAAKLAVSPAA